MIAHFMKEDAVLVMTIAASMLALQTFGSNSSYKNASILGLCLGLTASAKYVGAAMLVPAIVVLISTKSDLTKWLVTIGVSIAAFLLINAGGLSGGLKTWFLFELNHVTTDHGGLVYGYSSPKHLIDLWKSTSIFVLALWLVAIATAFRSQFSPLDRIVTFFPLAFLMLLQVSKLKTFHYVVPVSVLCSVAAVWACAAISKRRTQMSIPLVSILGLAILTTGWTLFEEMKNFTDHPATRMTEWIRTNIPANATLATEGYSGLPSASNVALDASIPSIPQSSVRLLEIAETGSIDALQRFGIDYVIVGEGRFARYFDPTVTAYDGSAAKQKQFFADLFSKYQPIHAEYTNYDLDAWFGGKIVAFDVRKAAP
jgi:hypothetical protein